MCVARFGSIGPSSGRNAQLMTPRLETSDQLRIDVVRCEEDAVHRTGAVYWVKGVCMEFRSAGDALAVMMKLSVSRELCFFTCHPSPSMYCLDDGFSIDFVSEVLKSSHTQWKDDSMAVSALTKC